MNGGAGRRVEVTQGDGQRVGEGRQHRMEETPACLPRPADGVADMLLVMPALGVFAGHVEPDRRRVRAGPTDGRAEGKGIERREIVEEGRADDGEQLAKYLRAEPPRGLHPLVVDAIDE